jgi:hypothetical protein
MRRKTVPAAVRFERHYIPEPNSGCWLWIGKISNRGYGCFDNHMAHRFAYELFVGPIPDGLVVDHQCNNSACVNPDHLKAMTQSANVRRYSDKKLFCPKGHPYDERNTYVNRGHRTCRICTSKAGVVWARRKREAKRVFPL